MARAREWFPVDPLTWVSAVTGLVKLALGQDSDQNPFMKLMMVIVGWSILFLLCWPLALLTLIVAPIIWLFSLPLRLIWICIEACFALVRAVLLLPARLLGHKARA